MTLQFWQGWPRGNRIFFLIFLSVFVAALIYMWVAYYVEPAPAIELQTISEAEIDDVAVDQIQEGPFNFTVKGNNYVILQRQLGTMLTTSETVAYAYLFVLALFVIGMLAVISTLGKFYYLAGMAIFILFVTTLSTEVLGVFGIYGKSFAIVIMALYGLTSFWFFYFATTTTFTFRVLAFTAITSVLWLVINFMSATEKPFLHLAAYGVEAGLIACGLFIVTVSHEIVAGFIFAVTQSSRTRKSLNHFLIITVIYLINLALAYSVRFGYIEWHIVTVDIFLLLTISSILGIWGIRQRQKTYEGIIDGDPYAVLAFLLTGALTFSAIAMFMLTANDTALSAILDVTIFAHIGFGLIFLTYVFSNFAGMLAQNYQVYKVLYTPNNMPFFTFRFAGVITTIALAIYNTWQVPVNNAKSGYFNALGDLYMMIQNKTIAQAYYDESRTLGYRGHHANYALANLEGSLFNAREENQFYDNACGPRPTQMSFLNLAQTYQAANDNQQAIVALKEGMTKLKKHDALENTLGLLYAKTGMPDSALKYLSAVKGSSSNLVGLIAMHRITGNDTVAELGNDPVMRVNQLALMNSISKRVDLKYELPKDTMLTLADAAAISNYLINTRGNDDTTFVRSVISLARKPSNDGFKEAILFASAIYLYNSGETKEGFTTLEEVTVTSEHQGKYNNILAMWALENNEPRRAAGYAGYAISQRGDSATVLFANQLYDELTKNPSRFANTNENEQKPADLGGKNKKYRVYDDALAAEAAGDSAKANIYFKWLANANPYFDNGVIAAARYFRNKGNTAYNLLAEALLYHPSSIKIRKEYALESARVGFEDYARNALNDLRGQIGVNDYTELQREVDALLRRRE
jgi:hypothetical protein